jgi:hypothetical protein
MKKGGFEVIYVGSRDVRCRTAYILGVLHALIAWYAGLLQVLPQLLYAHLVCPITVGATKRHAWHLLGCQ